MLTADQAQNWRAYEQAARELADQRHDRHHCADEDCGE
jgi:hypothetical protein